MCNNERPIYDETIKLKDNAMLKVRPDLFNEWDFEKNNELGLNIYLMTKGMEAKVWWNCPKCESPYDSTVQQRCKGQNCPYCRGYRVNETNSLSSLRFDVALEWHSSKNGEFTSSDVTCSSGKKVWWKCELGHEWEAVVSDRTAKNSGCPYCTNRKVLIGFNDMWTTDLELAKLLLNPEDGYRHISGSHSKLDWKCPTCDTIIQSKVVKDMRHRGLSCSLCSDGKSYPERFMSNLLKQLEITFNNDIQFDEWSDGKRYDFYIKEQNMVIEAHGGQHYFECSRGRSLKEEKENDKHKYEMAIQNGIYKYIVIDCMYSDFEYIKNNVLSSKMTEFFELEHVDWDTVNINSQKSINVESLELWNKGLSVKEISEITNQHYATVERSLKNYDKLGKCNYDSFRGKKKAERKSNVVYQFDNNFELIKKWDSSVLAAEVLGGSRKHIQDCCNGRYKMAYGFIWRYEKDLDEGLTNKLLA